MAHPAKNLAVVETIQDVHSELTLLHCAAVACGVLVIEDDPDLRQMITTLLELSGFAPVVATNGRDALEALRRGARPHVILLDLMMPVMDGYQFRRVQRADPAISDIPVVIATAAPLHSTTDLGAAEVLQKPLNFDETVAALRRYC